jgi:hypothetical protein
MGSTRTAVPRATREQVLSEYNHLCAICGRTNPQLHHIDGDNANHDPLNLLPLCPNHHLSDQHNPTHQIEPGRLVLFRRFKDPAILSPQFEPLYHRLCFLNDLDSEATDLETLRRNARELIDFVGALRMGEFYSKRLLKLLGRINHTRAISLDEPQSTFDRWHREEHAEYLAKLAAGRDEALQLCTELLRYQDWLPGDGI